MKLLEKVINEYSKYYANNVTLRSFTLSDVFPLYKATEHDSFNKYLLWNKPSSLEECVLFTKKLIKENELRNINIISIINKEDGAWIGVLKLIPISFNLKDIDYISDKEKEENINNEEKKYELSAWINPNYWGKMDGKVGAQLFVDILLNEYNETNLYARLNVDNKRINYLMLSTGFNLIGTIFGKNENNEDVKFNVAKIDKEKFNQEKTVNMIKFTN